MEPTTCCSPLDLAAQIEALGLDDLIRLQRQIAEIVCRRFTRRLAVVFTDIVDSTRHLQQLGDVGGYPLWQRHADLVRQVTTDYDGTVIDTVGDGTLSCFLSCSQALQAMSALQWAVAESNNLHATEPPLFVRAAVHCGDVLCDNQKIIGTPVNLCARLLNRADIQQILLSEDVFQELSPEVKAACRSLRPRHLKGFPGKVNMRLFDWQSARALLASQATSSPAVSCPNREGRGPSVVVPTPMLTSETSTPYVH